MWRKAGTYYSGYGAAAFGKATVLRPLPGKFPDQQKLYAAQFYDLTYEEDALIRKSVFAIQLTPH